MKSALPPTAPAKIDVQPHPEAEQDTITALGRAHDLSLAGEWSASLPEPDELDAVLDGLFPRQVADMLAVDLHSHRIAIDGIHVFEHEAHYPRDSNAIGVSAAGGALEGGLAERLAHDREIECSASAQLRGEADLAGIRGAIRARWFDSHESVPEVHAALLFCGVSEVLRPEATAVKAFQRAA